MLQKLSAYFFSDFNFKIQTLWFKRLLYLFLCVESIYYLCFFDVFFGEHSIVVVNPQPLGLFNRLAFLLYDSNSAGLSRLCILAIISLSLLNLFSSSMKFIADLLLWFLLVNLHYRIYPALTGGNNLLNQFLFFNCFLSAIYTVKNQWSSQLRICLHNLGVMAIIVQISLVYFLSALAKLGDEEWLTGKALIAVSQIRHFSLFSFLTYKPFFDPVLIFLNYLVLFYQLLFPVLIWIRNIKKPLLITGIVMHLYIAFVMGLVSFGFVMILAYVFFWPLNPKNHKK